MDNDGKCTITAQVDMNSIVVYERIMKLQPAIKRTRCKQRLLIF